MDTADNNDGFCFTDQNLNHKRTAVRYVRDDISAYLSYRKLLVKQTIAVKLLDISSKGASVLTAENLPINKKITLILSFRIGKQFEIKAKISRHGGHNSSRNELGIQFDHYNNALGDCLLATTSKLIFR